MRQERVVEIQEILEAMRPHDAAIEAIRYLAHEYEKAENMVAFMFQWVLTTKVQVRTGEKDPMVSWDDVYGVTVELSDRFEADKYKDDHRANIAEDMKGERYLDH